MKSKLQSRLVVFGGSGDKVYYGKNCETSGYGTPVKPHAARDIADGTPVLDIRPAIATNAGIKWAIIGPMVDVDLADGEVDKLPEIIPFVKQMIHPSMSGLVELQEAAETIGPLDHVCTQEYIDRWVELGALAGTYADGHPLFNR